jgi:uncharacterized protein YkwD
MQNFKLQGNWIDLVIFAVFVLFVSEAFRVGFWIIMADFLSFLLSLIVALWGYRWSAGLLRENFQLSHSLSNALGFLFTAIIVEASLGYVFSLLIRKIPYKYWKSKWSKLFGILPAFGEGVILVSFLLMLVMGLPLLPTIKSDINNSRIGGYLVDNTSGIEVRLNDVFGGVVENSLTYLTVKPESTETVAINVAETNLSVDERAETGMFELVNEERRERGIPELILREDVIPVARAHARDMWERQYFGHVSPDGKSVVERLHEAGVEFTLVGENLALAPTLTTAHNGLMNSEGHRRNILDPEFKRVGVGVVDNGIYGKMFVQVFTN